MHSSPEIIGPYQAQLDSLGIPSRDHGYDCKWLRDYLDFSEKYRLDRADAESLPPVVRESARRRQST